MNLLSWHDQRETIQYEKIKLIKNSYATKNYQRLLHHTNNQRSRTIANTLSELPNRNKLRVTITANTKNFATKENESELIKANNRLNITEHVNQLFKDLLTSIIKEYYNYCLQFKAEQNIQTPPPPPPPHKELHQQLLVLQGSTQFTVDVNLRADKRNNKVNANKNNTITTSTQLSWQQHLSMANNSIMTTTGNIIPPRGEPMITTSHVTTMYMSTVTSPATPTWPNAYESVTTDGSHNNNNNNNFLNSLKNFNATTNNGTSNDLDDNDSEMLRTIEYIGTVLSFYYVPIIVLTGSIGNILSVFVFFNTKLCKLSSSYYLAALAVSDTCFLLGLFAQWLNFVDVEIYNREYFCQFFTFFSNLACFCSAWFVVAFTVERFIAVMYPLQRQTMCTVRRAKLVILALTIVGCLHCTPFWICATPVYSPKLETTICDIKSEYKDYIIKLNYWDTIVVFVVPFTSIVVLNTFTGCTVWKFATVRRTLTMQKMKTQHLPLHGTISSPSSSRGISSAATTVAALANTGRAKTATATKISKQQQDVSTYCITSSSLKRQKPPTASCTNFTHANGQHNHIVNHHNNNQHQHHHKWHHPQQLESQHTHSYPNRATVIKQSASGNRDYADIFSRKSKRRKSTNSSQLKVTKMLLIVSTVFVCLNLPSFIMRMITYLETQSSANEKTTVVLQYIFQLLFVTNFGINFVLYCVSGQNFRKAVLSMFRKGSMAQRDGTTQITVSEYYRNSGGIAAAYGTHVSTRRRMTTQNSWNEMHELHRLK